MSGIQWSNEECSLEDFVKKNTPPQVVKVKKDAGKSPAFKSSVELILHESKGLKKVEACIVSDNKTFVLPYDCPAKVYQLTKAEEFTSLSALRKVLPTCRFLLITSKPKDQQLQDIERGEVLTIVFKKTISGCDVFTCERKKLGVKVDIKGNAEGGFAPMGTTTERKISDFVRSYSTFPVGIGLTQSTLANKAYGALNDLIMQSKSGLIRLTRLFTVESVIASSLGKKKMGYSIPHQLGLTVATAKALSQDESGHKEFCQKLHEDIDKASIDYRLTISLTFGKAESEVVQWSNDGESSFDEVSPLATGKSERNGGIKRGSAVIRKTSDGSDGKNDENKSKEKVKDAKESKTKDKVKKDEKEKEIVKEKPIKEKKMKEVKTEKIKVEKSKSNDKVMKQDEPMEDDGGYLVPAELLRAEKQVEKTGESKSGESKDRSSIGLSLGRFMGKVKGKKDGKKFERPEIIHQHLEEGPQARSSTMPAGSNIQKSTTLKNKGKTMSADELNTDECHDDKDGAGEKEVKKRDKKFSTAGKKAGKILREKLGKGKLMDDENSKSAPSLQSSSPRNNDVIDDQDMYVTPVDNHLVSSTPASSIFDRELPELPPEEPRKPSVISSVPDIPYDDDDLYDEINPVTTKTFKIPKDLSKLSTNEISDVLRAINMSEHVTKFRNEQIDGEIFRALDDKTLGALGVADPLQRLKIKKLLKGWRPKS